MGQAKSGVANVTPTTQGIAALNGVLPQVQQYTNPATYNPGQPYLQTAPMNPQQTLGLQTFNTAAGEEQQAFNTGASAIPYLNAAGQPLTQEEIMNYYNPAVQQQVGATEAAFANMNAQQQQQVVGNEVTQGAWGGDRSAVAGALTAQQQAIQDAPVIAGMYQSAYNTAEQTAAQQYQGVPLSVASGLNAVAAGEAGVAGQTANTGVAQLSGGTQEQQTQQAQDLANYMYSQAVKGYPIQLTQLAAQDIGGLSGAYGSNTTTTPPQPSIVNTLAGLGTFGLGAGIGYNQLTGGKSLFSRRGGRIPRQFGGQVQGLQTGGIPSTPYGASPIAGLGSMPYGGGGGFIPQGATVNIPKPQAGTPMTPPQDDSSKMFMDALQLSKLGGKGGSGSSLSDSNAADFGVTPADFESVGGRVSRAGGGTTISLPIKPRAITTEPPANNNYGSIAYPPYDWALMGQQAKQYGKAYGGLAVPSSNRINVPMRGGLGMPSFMPRRDAGGSANMSDTSTSSDTDIPPLNPMMANITYGLYGEAAPYGQGMAEGGSPDDNFTDADAEAAAAGPGVTTGPPPVASGPPPGLATAPAEAAPDIITKGPEAAKANNQIDRLKAGIAHVETGGERNPYGSVISTGTGHRVYGKYQIYDDNIPKWTQQALGRPMTPAQFLASPEAQEAVAGHKLGEYSSKYGPAGAARAWLAGEGGMNNPVARDKFGSDPYGYAAKVMAHAGLEDSGTQALAYGEEPPQKGLSTPTGDTGGIPGVTPIKAPDLSGKTKPDKTDIALSIMAAGLGMMGSRSPYAGVGIGQGGLQGIQTYEALHKQRVGEAEHQAGLEQQANIQNVQTALAAARQKETGQYHQAEITAREEGIARTMTPGTAQRADGTWVPGFWHWDPQQKKQVFTEGIVGKQPTGAGGQEQAAFERKWLQDHGRLPEAEDIAQWKREQKNLGGLDTGIINETQNYPDLKGKAGTLNIDKANQVKVKSAFQSSAHLENIAKYTTEHPGAIGLLAKASNHINLDAYKDLLGGVAADRSQADMEKAIDAVSSGNLGDVEAAKVINKMLITQAFNDASASGQRGGVYLDKVFRELYQQASSPKAFFGILGQRYEDANSTLKPYGLGLDKRSDKENFPFWQRLHGQRAETSTAAPQRKLSGGKYYIRGPNGEAVLDPNQSP